MDELTVAFVDRVEVEGRTRDGFLDTPCGRDLEQRWSYLRQGRRAMRARCRRNNCSFLAASNSVSTALLEQMPAINFFLAHSWAYQMLITFDPWQGIVGLGVYIWGFALLFLICPIWLSGVLGNFCRHCLSKYLV